MKKEQLPDEKTRTALSNGLSEKKIQVKPLTPLEIQCINDSEKQPPLQQSAELLEILSFLSKVTPSMLEKFFSFINSHSSYYTKDAFLKTFSICPNTLKKWMNKKGLPFIELDSIILFRKSDIDEFFNRYRKIIPLLITSLTASFSPMEIIYSLG